MNSMKDLIRLLLPMMSLNNEIRLSLTMAFLRIT
jgi:hypothetical protein